jgi:lipopolysaccharide/colanic/teichoic acid biosynthesis glycosyltransferase
MKPDSEKSGLLTVGGRDNRITPEGYILRKYKLDELPQLLNVLLGEMSLVGPRPEVRKYVDYYTDSEKAVLSVKPGITDYASLEYFDENEKLGLALDPEKEYIDHIMPEKLRLNLRYIKERSLMIDIKILMLTLRRIMISDQGNQANH